MVEVKGKFITLAAGFIRIYPKHFEKADQRIYEVTGLHQHELDPEGWYPMSLYTHLMDCYVEASPTKERALITLGKAIYPTIKRTVGFPPELETPLDFVQFEAQAYLDNIRGPGIRPRKISKLSDRHVMVRFRMEEQPCKIGEGVYQGILEIAGHPDGSVEHRQCIKNGDAECEFHITW